MRIEVKLEEWRVLYDIVIKFKELKFWEILWDMDLIIIIELNKKELCVCSIMGKGGECYGIVVYYGLDFIKGFFEMVYSSEMFSY